MDIFLCKYYQLRYSYQIRYEYDNNDQSLVLFIKNIKNPYQKNIKNQYQKISLKTGKSRFLEHSQSVFKVSIFYLEFIFL